MKSEMNKRFFLIEVLFLKNINERESDILYGIFGQAKMANWYFVFQYLPSVKC
jgi:hypothetical protein